MQQLKDEIAQLQAQNAEYKETLEKQSQETATQLARVCGERSRDCCLR